jgi:hypothetical protein
VESRLDRRGEDSQSELAVPSSGAFLRKIIVSYRTICSLAHVGSIGRTEDESTHTQIFLALTPAACGRDFCDVRRSSRVCCRGPDNSKWIIFIKFFILSGTREFWRAMLDEDGHYIYAVPSGNEVGIVIRTSRSGAIHICGLT